MKICPICQKKFYNTSKIKKYCSKICYKNQHKQYIQKYRIIYKEQIKRQVKEYQKNHRKEINKYWTKRLRTDIDYKLSHYLRTRLGKALKRNTKSEHTLELLSCSIKYLKKYLKSKFKSGMSWKNYGKWHIDHIRPCASFDLSKPEEYKECFKYTNLQPLWAEENINKGDKYAI